MFEFLIEEMNLVRTRKFFIVDGPASPELRSAVLTANAPLAPSYIQFVLRFGNSLLYRRNGSHLIEIYASPRVGEGSDEDDFFYFGVSEVSGASPAHALFRNSHLRENSDSPVFEWRRNSGARKVADGFEEWLVKKCTQARRNFRAEEWKAIIKGPAPLTDLEKLVVEARKMYDWKVVGIKPNGDIQFEIQNKSKMQIKYLTLRVMVRSTGREFGAVPLPVSRIEPGETCLVDFDCYKKYLAPENAFFEPIEDLGPEDRGILMELRQLPEGN